MSLPLVSVCIPTYNAAEFLESCLQSAIGQTHGNTEILISDDGSTDDTLSIVKKYQQKYQHIRLVHNANKGMVNNWNNCIEQAGADWIKFLFQDDILQPTCVEKLLEACLTNNIDVGFCRRKFIIHDGVPNYLRHDIKYRMVLPERIFEDSVFISPEHLAKELAEVLPDNALGEPTCFLFNKKIFECTHMFNPDFRQTVDMEFLLRLGLIKGIVFVVEPLALFRVHVKSATSANLKDDKAAQIRNIAAINGDKMLLFYKFLHDPAFKEIKNAMGEDVLQLKLNYMYYSGCKKKGKRTFNTALAPIREKYKELGEMKYSFFKYVHYRRQYRKWERENRW